MSDQEYPKDPKEVGGQRLNFIIHSVREAQLSLGEEAIIPPDAFDAFVEYDQTVYNLQLKRRKEKDYVFTDDELRDVEQKGQKFIDLIKKRNVI